MLGNVLSWFRDRFARKPELTRQHVEITDEHSELSEELPITSDNQETNLPLVHPLVISSWEMITKDFIMEHDDITMKAIDRPIADEKKRKEMEWRRLEEIDFIDKERIVNTLFEFTTHDERMLPEETFRNMYRRCQDNLTLLEQIMKQIEIEKNRKTGEVQE